MMAAASSLPPTMVVLRMGMVSRVSRVLFSFSLPIEEMTTLPTMMMTIITMMGTMRVCPIMEL